MNDSILNLNLNEAADFELYPSGEERLVDIVRADIHVSQKGNTMLRITTQDAKEPVKYVRCTTYLTLSTVGEQDEYQQKLNLSRIKKFAKVFNVPESVFVNLDLSDPTNNPLVGRQGIVVFKQSEDRNGNPQNDMII